MAILAMDNWGATDLPRHSWPLCRQFGAADFGDAL